MQNTICAIAASILVLQDKMSALSVLHGKRGQQSRAIPVVRDRSLAHENRAQSMWTTRSSHGSVQELSGVIPCNFNVVQDQPC